MSFSKLMGTINKFEKSPSPGVLDITPMLLPIGEVVKNILVIENNLPKEDAELLVDGFIPSPSIPSLPSIPSINMPNVNVSIPNSPMVSIPNIPSPTLPNFRKKSKTQKEIENLKTEGDTKFKSKMIDDSVKENIKSVVNTDTGAPLPSSSPYHKKAKEILALVKEKVTQFFRKVKELLMEIGAAVVSIVASIPGAALMVSPFAFNVPGMITMLMQMIQLLSMLASKMADLTSFFKYFKHLPLVLSPSNLNSVSSAINSSYQSVSVAFKPLESGIAAFLSSSKRTIKSKSKGDKIPRYITARLRRAKYIRWVTPSSFNFEIIGGDSTGFYGYGIPIDVDEIARLLKDDNNKVIRVGYNLIPREELLKKLTNQVGGSVIQKELLANNLNGYVIDKDFKNVSEDDIDEVEDILENWEVVFLNNKRVAVRQKKMLDAEGNEVTMDQLIDGLDKIEALVDSIKETLPDPEKEDEFIYDVQFSDGRSLFGLTKQDIDGLEVTYNVIYSDSVKYSFI